MSLDFLLHRLHCLSILKSTSKSHSYDWVGLRESQRLSRMSQRGRLTRFLISTAKLGQLLRVKQTWIDSLDGFPRLQAYLTSRCVLKTTTPYGKGGGWPETTRHVLLSWPPFQGDQTPWVYNPHGSWQTSKALRRATWIHGWRELGHEYYGRVKYKTDP